MAVWTVIDECFLVPSISIFRPYTWLSPHTYLRINMMQFTKPFDSVLCLVQDCSVIMDILHHCAVPNGLLGFVNVADCIIVIGCIIDTYTDT